ncbi:hypothetical protein OIDMADRAFT_134716 [Oidiodendron maius Zn]|uniref:C2H2-type domain-containing protein n=1 Tax=Oidiodendron maius (strain Zn) TaxID=913774 RepID=A0A0C3C7V2_OIDMZ|nr:hypothetical protein OIDMADRAFT_134716 [Oidiodendron maius Zn]
MPVMDELFSCPFCGLQTDNGYQIMLHMEEQHPEGGQSPFIVKDDSSVAAVISMGGVGDNDPDFTSCPINGCGEIILFTELDNHIEMHDMEGQDGDQETTTTPREYEMNNVVRGSFDTTLSYELRNLPVQSSPLENASSERKESAKETWKAPMKMPERSTRPASAPNGQTSGTHRRLGKSELGPYANENQMPPWLVKLLESDGEVKITNRMSPTGKLKKVKSTNHTEDILPVLAQLLDQDHSTRYAYLCHPSVKHVSKLKREGGFCGYRNIQMLSSYINGVESQGYQCFDGKVPTIFEIQDYIEYAWDLDINSQGRIETGGIRGTRKYIGTPDAQAMFCSLEIACEAQAFKSKRHGPSAHDLLFQAVENYFVNGCTTFDKKVRLTSLPPLYFQQPGHSMTIVGMERRMDGSKTLVVFDPMFHDASNVTKLVGQAFIHRDPGGVLKAYRRGLKYLIKYNEFEILK